MGGKGEEPGHHSGPWAGRFYEAESQSVDILEGEGKELGIYHEIQFDNCDSLNQGRGRKLGIKAKVIQ